MFSMLIFCELCLNLVNIVPQDDFGKLTLDMFLTSDGNSIMVLNWCYLLQEMVLTRFLLPSILKAHSLKMMLGNTLGIAV